MLVLTRKPGETIHIGPDITVSVERFEGNYVRLGLVAPDHVAIVRGELVEGGQYPLGEAVPAEELILACEQARLAIHDTIRRPMGVEPDSATAAYRMIDAVLARVRRKRVAS